MTLPRVPRGLRALLLGALVLVLLAGGGAGATWLLMSGSDGSDASAAMFRGNAARTGEYPGPGVETSPMLAWRVPVTGSGGSPVVAGSVTYVLDSVSDSDDHLNALDRTTGEELWKVSLIGDGGTPAVVDNVVYVGHGESVSSTRERRENPGIGYVSALDAATGTEIWRAQTPGRARSPVVVDGTVYVGTDSGYVYALDSNDGGIRWTLDEGGSYASVSVSNGLAIVALGYSHEDDKGAIHALDAASGEKRWRVSLPKGPVGVPAIRDGVVYVGTHSFFYALGGSTGETLWRFELDGFAFTTGAAVADDTVFLTSGIESGLGYLHALEPSSGIEVWRLSLGDAAYGSSPAFADGVVYAGSLDNHLYAVDATSGRELWRFETGASIYSSPAVLDGAVYFGSADGYVYAIGGGEGGLE